MKNLFNILLIIALLGAAVYIQHRFFPTVEIETKTEWDTTYIDTGSVRTVHPKPKIVYRDTGSVKTIEVEIPVDSAELVRRYLALHKDFYTKNIYQDTLKDDTSALVIVRDTVYMNELQKRDLVFANRRPTVIKKTTNIYNQTKLYGGIQGGKGNFQPSIMLHTKKDWNFMIGYDLEGQDAGIRAGAYIKIWDR